MHHINNHEIGCTTNISYYGLCRSCYNVWIFSKHKRTLKRPFPQKFKRNKALGPFAATPHLIVTISIVRASW